MKTSAKADESLLYPPHDVLGYHKLTPRRETSRIDIWAVLFCAFWGAVGVLILAWVTSA